MKEFDIYLKDRIIECDIVVYSIPLRTSQILISRMEPGVEIRDFLVKKNHNAKAKIIVGADAGRIFKTIRDAIDGPLHLGVSASFDKVSLIGSVQSQFELYQDSPESETVHFSAVFPTGAISSAELSVDPVLIMVHRSTGRMNAGIGIAETIQNLQKVLIERPKAPICFGTDIKTHKQGYFGERFDLTVTADLKDLLFFTRSPEFESVSMCIGSQIDDFEIHHPFSRMDTFMEICAEIADGTFAKKYEQSSSPIAIHAEADISLSPSVESVSALLISAELGAFTKRYRILEDMDRAPLSSYDDMTLEDLDYVILQA